MENVTKALLIAAGVMIGIILMAIGTYLFSRYRNISESYYETLTVQEIAKINKEFEKYTDPNKNGKITPQEVVAAVTTVQSINDRFNTENVDAYDAFGNIDRTSTYYTETIVIQAFGTDVTLTNSSTKADCINFIKSNLRNTFECHLNAYYESGSNNGMIKEIYFYQT